MAGPSGRCPVCLCLELGNHCTRNPCAAVSSIEGMGCTVGGGVENASWATLGWTPPPPNCAIGAVAARPSTRWTLSLLKWRSRSSRLTHFVNMSAGFWSPCTLNMVKSQRRSPSWTHNWPTARCLTRPMPLLRQIPIAAAESACMRTFMQRPRSNPQD